MTTAYSTFNLSYTNAVPYLTVAEFTSAPTALDLTNLVSNGTPAQQVNAIAEVIQRASSAMDSYVSGAWGTMSATVNTENGRIYGDRMGRFRVHPKYWPVLEVQSFSYSFTPGDATSITPANNVWIEPHAFMVQPNGTAGFGLNVPSNIGTYEYLCEWTYVNGWPNTLTAASVAAGASSVTVQSAVGIYPGTSLQIYDSPNDETITVASTYAVGSTTLPLTSPVARRHAAGISVTNLPGVVKQAAILWTSALIKQRGSAALVINDLGETQAATSHDAGRDADIVMAMELLDPLRTIALGY